MEEESYWSNLFAGTRTEHKGNGSCYSEDTIIELLPF